MFFYTCRPCCSVHKAVPAGLQARGTSGLYPEEATASIAEPWCGARMLAVLNLQRGAEYRYWAHAGEESCESGEQLGYLGTTASSSIRKGTTLEQHKYHIAGVKVAHAEHRAAITAEKTSPQKDGMNQDGNNVPDLVAMTLTPLSTTLLEQQQLQGLKQAMNPIEKRKNMVILERMHTKLDLSETRAMQFLFSPTPERITWIPKMVDGSAAR